MAFGKKAWIGSDRRADPRVRLSMPAEIVSRDGSRLPIIIRDLSTWGFRASLPHDLRLRSMFQLALVPGLRAHAQVVRVDPDACACEFLIRLDDDQFARLAEQASAAATTDEAWRLDWEPYGSVLVRAEC